MGIAKPFPPGPIWKFTEAAVTTPMTWPAPFTRTAGIARADVGRHLDQAVDFLRAAGQGVFRVYRAVQCAHRTGFVGQWSADTPGVAKPDGRFADDDLAGVADRRRGQSAPATELEHRDV